MCQIILYKLIVRFLLAWYEKLARHLLLGVKVKVNCTTIVITVNRKKLINIKYLQYIYDIIEI